MRTLELLSPAKNLECGIAAIDHGADAVYIGAERFGARSAAGNPLEDIEALCSYAHRFFARVYVTVNTILYDDELDETRQLIEHLQSVGVDALLVQDMGILQMRRDYHEDGKSFPVVHASTQTDNRTIEKVRWLRDVGFRRIVLARELSLDDIRLIHEEVPDVELEAFIHGSLCVSYSGVCYASQYCFGRSANRGECAQFCRMKFDLLDSDGNVLARQRHLLSLRDMCRIDAIAELADAGVSSFKIEGRLKDVTYVKNVVTAYSQRLDKLVEMFPEKFCRLSLGKSRYLFIPQLDKSFNRGFTDYFLKGRTSDITSFDTPKAVGEPVGKVKELRRNCFTVADPTVFNNGDGLCFFNTARELEGFRINCADSNCLYPQRMPSGLRVGLELFRNHDADFEYRMKQKTAVRKIPVHMIWAVVDSGFLLTVSLMERNISVSVQMEYEHEIARKPQGGNIRHQLSKLGDTVFVCVLIETDSDADNYFVPSSFLADIRRRAIVKMEKTLRMRAVDVRVYEQSMNGEENGNVKSGVPVYTSHPYMYNVSNRLARAFYLEKGMRDTIPAFELNSNVSSKLLMQCRHCLQYEFRGCGKYGRKGNRDVKPAYLRLADGRRFRLEFDCKQCQMNVYAEN